MLNLGHYTEATDQLLAPATIFTEGGPSVHIVVPRKICAGCKTGVDEYGLWG